MCVPWYPFIQQGVEDTVGLSEIPTVYPSTQHHNQEGDTAVRNPGILTCVYSGVQRDVLGIDSLCIPLTQYYLLFYDNCSYKIVINSASLTSF